MKKIILTIFCVLCLSLTAMAKEYHSYEIKTCGDLMCDLNDRPITGSVKKSAGSYTLESFYTNGIKERADVYENGTLSSKIYCANKKAEKQLVFHHDGKLGEEAYFKNEKTEGKVYDKNGNLIAVISFNEKADGIIKIFAYPNVTVCELPFINGKLDGVLKASWMCPIDFSLEIGKEVEIVFQNGKPISGYKYYSYLNSDNGRTELTNAHLYNIQPKITLINSASEYFSKLLPTYTYEMNEVCKE